MNDNSFSIKPVADLLNGESIYHFRIPSYQRGYRWEEKQVLDMLNDIKQFADDGITDNTYYLQPLVVKTTSEQNTWEVVDGQQRLTTMLLILKRIMRKLNEDDREYFENKLYDIRYNNRPQLDFDNPSASENIDSYYLSEAKKTIDDWFESYRGKDLNTFYSVLLYSKDDGKEKKQATFIWYPISDENDEANSINVFNRLNNGKIGLTSSELIKALFILNSKKEEHLDAKTLAIEWDAMERKLQDNSFWYFISDNPEGYQTRIDLLFDFVTEKRDGEDDDSSYRKFQVLFDICNKVTISKAQKSIESFWENKKVQTMEDAWLLIKKDFDRLQSWYEDNTFYHYIGFLIAEGDKPLDIYNALEKAKTNSDNCNEWTIEQTKQELYKLIRCKFVNKQKELTLDEIKELKYTNGTLVRRTLLLFNIESCVKTKHIRFSFDAYRDKKQHWDIEHVNSQNDSDLQKNEERKAWMERVKGLLAAEKDDNAKGYLVEINRYIDIYNMGGAVSHDKYKDIYNKITQYYDPDNENLDKDRLGNLTILDSGTNREYHDSPFPYKRQCIIDKDREGETFIPICTRNLFLKYYSDKGMVNSMKWTISDMDNYEKSIIDTLMTIFVSSVEEGGNNE